MFAKHALKLKTILTMLLAMPLVFVSLSCNSDDSDYVSASGDGARLSLSISSSDESLSRALSNDGAARDIVPEDDILSLGSLSLTGARAGGAEQTIATGDSLSEFIAALAEKTISTGSWNFTLTAVLNGVTYEGTSGSVQIKVGTNAISITLEEPSGSYYGGISLAISYSGSASRVTAKITSADGSTTVCPEEDLSLATAGKITYTKAQNDAGQRIPSGKYLVTVTFYGGDDQSLLLNTYREYVRIVPGRTSSAQRELDLNEVYTITYYDVDESGSTSVIDGTTVTFVSSAPAQFSRRSAFSLPLPAKPGYVFEGWYKDAACTDGNEITQIAKGTVQDMAVYAKWKEVRYAAITDESGVTTAYKDCASLVNAIKNATGNIELVLYESVTTAELGKSETADTIIDAIRQTGADTLALVVDQNAGLALPVSANSLFYGCSKLVSADLRGLDTSSVTQMWNVFQSCSSLAAIDLTGLDTSKVKSMGGMFSDCSSLASIDLTGLITSSVTTMASMFSGCSKLTSVNVTELDTSSVTTMASMFYGCSSLTSVDLTGLNTAKVTNMSEMFSGCSALTSIDLTELDTSSVTTMRYMFYGCSSLASIDLTRLNTSKVTTMESMFRDCSALASIDLTGLNTSSVTTMKSMFERCAKLASLTLAGLDTSSVTDMGFMFFDCSSLASIDLTGLNTSSVTTMRSMFFSCNLTSVNLAGLDTSSVTDMGNMFFGCLALASIDLTGLDTSSVADMGSMFYGCSSLASIDLTRLNTSKVTTMESMFRDCSALASIDLTGLDTSKVTTMRYMFYGCSSLASIDLTGLDTSSVTSMGSMFYNCSTLTSIDLTGLNTSSVTSMSDMFYNCTSLTSVDLTGLNTSSVTIMGGMFYNCSALASIDLAGLDTSSVNNMSSMFSNCKVLKTIYVSSTFDTTNVMMSTTMFSSCSALTGGAGTTFDSNHIDKTYARIDGGTAAPGYFTEKILPVILYVSDTTKSPAGNDYSGNGTESAPYATIAKAFAHINEAATADKDWEIRISGSFGGANTIPSGLAAQSLTLVGVNYGEETEGAHDGFWGADAKNVISLTTAADIPVTLKKIYISGGNPALSVTGSGEVTLEQSGVNGNVQGINISGNADVTVSGSWIAENTGSTNGGGIYKAGSGTLTIKDSTVEKNTASEKGGGVYVAAGSLLLGENGYIGQPEDTSEHGNTALRGGGIYIAGGASLRMEDKSGVICNKANYDSDGGDGGGVYSDGTFTMAGGTINGNIANLTDGTAGNGGGVFIGQTGTMFMYGNAVIGDAQKTDPALLEDHPNVANSGAGIFSHGKLYMGYSAADTEAELTGGVFRNYASDTGGVTTYGPFIMKSGSISNNAGRGVYVVNYTPSYVVFTMKGGTISGNTYADTETTSKGGGVYAGFYGHFDMQGGTLSGNHARLGGGAVAGQTNSKITMSGGTIKENTAFESGGGVYNFGTFTMTGGTISANTASGSLETQGGGGVYNSGTVSLSGGTVSGNTASSFGGGIVNTGAGTACIYGTAVIGDSSQSTAATATSCSNTAEQGGGIYSLGRLYFGYSSYTDEETNTPAAFSGGICCNYAGMGGGILVAGGTMIANALPLNYNGSDGGGGGLFVDVGSGTVTINDCAVSGNFSTDDGGGILLMSGNMSILGGTIAANASANNGGAIGMLDDTSLILGGGISIPFGGDVRQNDVYMNKTNCYVQIASALTASLPLATITPEEYTAGTQILTLASGAGTTLAAESGKFSVTQDSSNPDTPWRIDTEGKLKDKYGDKDSSEDYAVGDIVFNDGSALPYTSGLTLTNSQKAAAIALIFYKGTDLNSGDNTATNRTLGVGLKHNKSLVSWCRSSAKAYSTNITTIQCPPSGPDRQYTFEGDKNGSDNLEQIADFLGENNDTGVGENSTKTKEEAAALYPAFYFAKNYKDVSGSNVSGTAYEEGWYLPSIAELFQVYVKGRGSSKVFAIDEASQALGGDTFGSSYYWSSSQSNEGDYGAYNLFLDSGRYTGDGCYKSINKYSGSMAVCCIREF